MIGLTQVKAKKANEAATRRPSRKARLWAGSPTNGFGSAYGDHEFRGVNDSSVPCTHEVVQRRRWDTTPVRLLSEVKVSVSVYPDVRRRVLHKLPITWSILYVYETYRI
jgi:hypothetical protein